MTREEIIDGLYKGDGRAIKAAIEALELCEYAISRQDALDALHMCLSTNSYDDDVTGDSYICYEEAEYEIEKLPSVQPKQVECEDAISRQAAIEVAKQYWYKPDIAGALAELPPVQLQTKTGHWIANAPQYDMLNPQYICSECGNAHTRTTPYCEMCGARMICPQENEG